MWSRTTSQKSNDAIIVNDGGLTMEPESTDQRPEDCKHFEDFPRIPGRTGGPRWGYCALRYEQTECSGRPNYTYWKAKDE